MFTFFKLWAQILVAFFCECVYSFVCPYLFTWLKCAGSPSKLNIDHPSRQLLILSVCFVYLHVQVWLSLVILWFIVSYIWIWKLDAAYILLSPLFSWLYWLSGNFTVLTLLIACFSWFSWVWLLLGTSSIPPCYVLHEQLLGSLITVVQLADGLIIRVQVTCFSPVKQPTCLGWKSVQLLLPLQFHIKWANLQDTFFHFSSFHFIHPCQFIVRGNVHRIYSLNFCICDSIFNIAHVIKYW